MPHADGWIVALADMPWIAPATVVHIRTALERGAGLVAPFHHGQRGHPVGFGKNFRDELLACKGDRGARDILQAHARALANVDVDDPGVLRDVDTPQDIGSVSRRV